MILSNFCSIMLFKIFLVYEIITGFPPKFPNYVTFDLNNCIIRFGSSRAIFLLLQIGTKY